MIRVSIVNYQGALLFDSVIQPSKPLQYVPLFDVSFGIPLKYLSQMLNTIFEKRVMIGFNLQQLVDMLKLKQQNVVFSFRDLGERPEISKVSTKTDELAKKFFDADIN